MVARNLGQLPLELLLSIARYLPSQRDVNFLVQSSRRLYHCLHFFLCRYNVRNHQGTALLWAAQNGYTHLATKLLDAGLRVASFESPTEVAHDQNTADDDFKNNPLLICARSRHIETLKRLLSERRPGQTCSSAQLRTVLHWAVSTHQKQLVELMIEHEAPLDPAGSHPKASSALGVAVSSRYGSVVPYLLALGANPGENERPCPLEQAIYTDQPQLFELLLKHHIPMNSDKDVCYIAARGDTSLLQLLINYGVDMSVYGGAALLEAVKEGHYDMTELLIDNGADPNLEAQLLQGFEERFFYSAIRFSIHYGRLDILKLLLNKGILPGVSDLLWLGKYPVPRQCAFFQKFARKICPPNKT